MKLFLGAIAGLIFGIILITIATLLILKLRRKKITEKKDENNSREEYGGILVNGQSVQITNDGNAIRDSCSGSTESLDEKNPDIIPQGTF